MVATAEVTKTTTTPPTAPILPFEPVAKYASVNKTAPTTMRLAFNLPIHPISYHEYNTLLPKLIKGTPTNNTAPNNKAPKTSKEEKMPFNAHFMAFC